jgi:S1-C subfamily serine protease
MQSSPWSRRVPPTRPVTQPGSPPSGARPQVPDRGPPTPERPLPSFNPGGAPGSLAPRSHGLPASQDPNKGKRKRQSVLSKQKLMIGGVGLGAALLLAGFVVLGRSANNVQSSDESDSVSVGQPAETIVSSSDSVELPEGSANWDELARSVVFIRAASPCDWRGSGTLVLDGSYVLTNEHVSSDGSCRLTVGLTESLSSEPVGDLDAIVVARDVENDLAVLRLVDPAGNPIIPDGHLPVEINFKQPPLGAKLTTLGYPALGTFDTGMTITFTSGDFSGIDNTFGEFYKTTAQMRGGVSGGAAFTNDGLFIGVPTGGFLDEETGEDVGINLIRPAKYAEPLLAEAQQVDPAAPRDSTDQGGSNFESSATDPRFNTCREAKANGYGPYYYGIHAEYDWYRDADSDGVVCE